MSTIAADDANIVYSPYTWDVSAARAKTICAGAYLRMAFTGDANTLTATFDVSSVSSRPSKVGFRVDGGPWQDYAVAASIALTMPTNNDWPVHTVEMVVIGTSQVTTRWQSPQTSAVKFTGLTADVAVTTRITRTRPLYGIAFGDSITEGIQVLNANLELANDVDRYDARLAWSWPLCDILGAEIGVIGFGATGLTRDGNGGVPRFPDSAPYLWDGLSRSLSTPRPPDFIVAHLGTNDTAATDAEVTSEATRLLNYWLANTPDETKILVLPNWLQRKQSAIAAGIAASTAPTRVTLVGTTGWWNAADSPDGLHPYGYVNISDLAPRVGDAVKSIIGDVGSPAVVFIRDSFGNAIPISSTAF